MIFKKFTSPIVWGNLLAMIAVVVLLFVGLVWWLDSYTHHGEGIEVPDFCNMRYAEAISRGDELGLVVIANDSTYNKALPAGCVVLQKPLAGAKVKEGRTVYVTINSLTMPLVSIPNLIDNCSYREAQAKLLALDFKLTDPKLIDGDKDWVYGIQCNGRNITNGDLVPKESTLTLVIGNRSPDDDMDDELLEDSLNAADNDFDEDDIDTFLEIPDIE
jgi:beta-lactam-binding protein with PASTA domain